MKAKPFIRMYFSQKADSNLDESKESFDIESALKICEFCSEEELTSNARLKLLILRDRGEIEFKNAKAVPLRDWEIPQDIFKVTEIHP